MKFLIQFGDTFLLTKFCKTTYKLELQKSVCNLFGQIPKRDIVSIDRIQYISKTTIIYRAKYESLQDGLLLSFESSRLQNSKNEQKIKKIEQDN